MIFTFPALVSENVDKRLLPGILKTLEAYYLHHISDAILSGDLKFKIDLSSSGKASNIRIENTLFDGSKELLTEANNGLTDIIRNSKAVDSRIKSDNNIRLQLDRLDKLEQNIMLVSNKNTTPTTSEVKDLQRWKKDQRDQQAMLYTDIGKLQAKYNIDSYKSGKEEIVNYQRELDSRIEKAVANVPATVGKAGLKPIMDMGFVPTMIQMAPSIEIHDYRLNETYYQARPMTIGVKILPVIAKNFGSMYQVLRDDYYSNTLRYLFKAMSRGILRALYSTYVTKTLKKYYEYIFGTLSPDEIGNTKSDWYFSILLSKKALINAGSFKKMPTGLPTKQYAAAIAVMNKDEKEDMFADPKKVHRLFLMGWNTFIIMDDREKQVTMCSAYDRGKCTTVPYSFIYRQIDADQIYKDYEELNSKGRGAFFRKMKGGFKMKRLARESEQYINEKFKEYNETLVGINK
jgi:hypothetical protein